MDSSSLLPDCLVVMPPAPQPERLATEIKVASTPTSLLSEHGRVSTAVMNLSRRRLQLHEQRSERGNLERLIKSFRGDPPTSVEQAAIISLWRSVRHDHANTVMRGEDGVRLITSGWAAWVRYADDGQRLIFLFLLPGDFIVPSLFEPGCCDVISLTPIRTVDASPLLSGAGTPAPKLISMVEESGKRYRLLLIDHLTRLMSGCTTRSVANLLCEFHARALRAGWCEEGRFSLPIGQRVLARALGRSSVQINKIINQFQAKGLIKVGYDWIEVLEPQALCDAAGATHSTMPPAFRKGAL